MSKGRGATKLQISDVFTSRVRQARKKGVPECEFVRDRGLYKGERGFHG